MRRLDLRGDRAEEREEGSFLESGGGLDGEGVFLGVGLVGGGLIFDVVVKRERRVESVGREGFGGRPGGLEIGGGRGWGGRGGKFGHDDCITFLGVLAKGSLVKKYSP